MQLDIANLTSLSRRVFVDDMPRLEKKVLIDNIMMSFRFDLTFKKLLSDFSFFFFYNNKIGHIYIEKEELV